MCHPVFMYNGTYKNTNKQMVQSNIYQTQMELWCKIKYIGLDNHKYVFYNMCYNLIDERECEINSYNY